jgi:hypothetical protein
MQKCLCCDRKMTPIIQDGRYNQWKRKYHKKCWKESSFHYGIYLQFLKVVGDEVPNPTAVEYYKKKACML